MKCELCKSHTWQNHLRKFTTAYLVATQERDRASLEHL